MKYQVIPLKPYRRSLKKLRRSGDFDEPLLDKVIDMLALGKPLEPKYRDHQLTGDLKEYRECHVKGDLLLVYQIEEERILLVLADIGSHSYLGL